MTAKQIVGPPRAAAGVSLAAAVLCPGECGAIRGTAPVGKDTHPMHIDLVSAEDTPKFSARWHNGTYDAGSKLMVNLGRSALVLLTVDEVRSLASAILEALRQVPDVVLVFTCDMCGQTTEELDRVLDLGGSNICVNCYRLSAN